LKTLARIAMLTLVFTAGLSAQTPPPTGITFGAYGGAMAFCVGGPCNVGSLSVQTLSITPALNFEASQFIVPGPSMQGYFGGVSYALPIDSWLGKNTVLPLNTFRVSLHGSPGLVNNSSGAGSNKFGAFAGAEVDIAPMGDGKFVFGPRVDAIYAPGFGSGTMGAAYSMNIGYLFGGQKVAGATSQARKTWGTKR
jgi:hypothetical protein